MCRAPRAVNNIDWSKSVVLLYAHPFGVLCVHCWQKRCLCEPGLHTLIAQAASGSTCNPPLHLLHTNLPRSGNVPTGPSSLPTSTQTPTISCKPPGTKNATRHARWGGSVRAKPSYSSGMSSKVAPAPVLPQPAGTCRAYG